MSKQAAATPLDKTTQHLIRGNAANNRKVLLPKAKQPTAEVWC